MNLEKFYNKAFDWVVTFGPRILIGLLVLFVGLRIIGLIKKRIRNQMSRRQIHSSLQPFFLSLAITALHILLVLSVMSIIGLELSIFTTLIGALTVTAGLALSGTLQNFAGGIFILLLKPFTIDDNIIAQGVDGVVTSIQIFYTEILTADNKTVIIPNGKLFNEIITNVSREGKRRLDIEIKLTYAIDIEQVKGIIDAAIKANKSVLPDPAPTIGISALEVDGIKIVFRVWLNTADYGDVRLQLQEKVLADLKAAGAKLPGL
jgi:small conductance mechanosensitive channel